MRVHASLPFLAHMRQEEKINNSAAAQENTSRSSYVGYHPGCSKGYPSRMRQCRRTSVRLRERSLSWRVCQCSRAWQPSTRGRRPHWTMPVCLLSPVSNHAPAKCTPTLLVVILSPAPLLFPPTHPSPMTPRNPQEESKCHCALWPPPVADASPSRPPCCICNKHDMNDSAMRLSTRMKTERVCAVAEGSQHALYFSCSMSRLERLICARILWKSSSGGSSQVSFCDASFACANSCDQSCIAISILEERLRESEAPGCALVCTTGAWP
mmetsp:Transcript_19264/g.48143  ORF Transcript_19264/g.48143 Transcript_19264/m.48143 type:complete len:268 (+) Transcript_19264:151-954(+)